MSDLIFLPDREGRDNLTNATGFVRIGADASALQQLADRLVLPPTESAQVDEAMWRGVLALALMCDAWPGNDAALTVQTVDGMTSLFAAWVLQSRPEKERRDPAHLILLERGGKKVLLGLADAHRGVKLPATLSRFDGMVPARCTWYDNDLDIWHDPVPFLNEQERAVLYARLEVMRLDDAAVTAFKQELTGFGKEAIDLVRNEDEGAIADLSTRIQAVCGLNEFEGFAVRQEMVEVAVDNPLVRLYADVDVRYSASRVPCTYLWQGVPFARTSSALGLTESGHPDEEAALSAMNGELLMLSESSVAWNRNTARAIGSWLTDQDPALIAQACAQAEIIRQFQQEKGREVQMTVTLEWPWDASSGAVKYLLREALGDGWMSGAANPFADRLTKLTGHVLGDNALQNACACADGVLLPPLSQAMAACVANAAEGEGLALDALRFEPREDGGITVSILLRGAGEIRMVRHYAIGEILVISEEESPTVAVWPCIPLERWKAYNVFTRAGNVQIAALSGGEWTSIATESAAAERPWRCLHTETYPACLTVMQGDLCLGALPNTLPLCRINPAGDAVAAIDMGSSCTAVALTIDGKPVSAEGRQLTRLLVTPQEMPADDFLISLTPTAITPSSVALIGEGDRLFTDGYVYAVTRFDALRDMAPGTVHTSLKWRADAASVRARRILLHQVMLGMSLNAMLCGVETLRWRVTVADEMGDEGRNALLDMVESLSAEVAQETGLPITPGKNAVIWAEEAAALHAYLRGPAGQKGSIAVLDVGAASTKLHLWMQGRVRPSAGAVLMEGTQTALLHALQDDPVLLRNDFMDCGDPGLMAAVDVLCDQLSRSRENQGEANKALLMLDALLDEYKAPVTQHLYARFQMNQPTHMQSILLEMLAGAMFCVGLMLEQAGDDAIINHLFPNDLTICLTGRGAWLLETLTPQLRSGLQRIAHAPMALRHPVRSVTIRPEKLPAMATALGMAALRETEMPIDPPIIRTHQSFSELMRLLMASLLQCFPTHTWLLHPGMVDPWGNMTPMAEDAIRQAASAAYGDGEYIPQSVMDFLRTLRKTPMMMNYISPMRDE